MNPSNQLSQPTLVTGDSENENQLSQPQGISGLSNPIVGQLQAAEQEGSTQTSQELGQPHMNP
jgi:hypothetical protein